MNKHRKNPKLTMLMLCIACVVLYLMTGWRLIIPAALGIGLIGVFSASLSSRIDDLWMKFASLLQRVMTRVLLLAIFFLLLLPVALLSRLFGAHDPLNLKNQSSSNFKNVSKTFDKASFEKPW